jgi:hypothetical protein
VKRGEGVRSEEWGGSEGRGRRQGVRGEEGGGRSMRRRKEGRADRRRTHLVLRGHDIHLPAPRPLTLDTQLTTAGEVTEGDGVLVADVTWRCKT